VNSEFPAAGRQRLMGRSALPAILARADPNARQRASWAISTGAQTTSLVPVFQKACKCLILGEGGSQVFHFRPLKTKESIEI
jgi:hypothetical protein